MEREEPKSCFNDGKRNRVMPSDEVHIWRIFIDSSTSTINRLRNILSETESQRASRFYFATDRNRFIVARGVLRHILSDYCNCSPEAHKFTQNSYGKPMLAGGGNLKFNVSHSGEAVLVGVAFGRDIGVDVEAVRPFKRSAQIVERFFSEQEKHAFSSLPHDMQNEAFFRCWTRKEAYIKAVGKGMSISLAQFSTALLPGEPPRLLTTPPDETASHRWSMAAVKLWPGYIGAAVVEGQNITFQEREWTW